MSAGAFDAKGNLGDPVLQVREDLRLSQGRPAPDGSPIWLVHDPLTQRYHELDLVGFTLLSQAPGCTSPEEVSTKASVACSQAITVDDVNLFVRQMEAAGLTAGQSQNWRSLWTRQQAQKHGVFTWMLHNYLFIRVPLFRPQNFLKATLPLAMALVGRAFLTVLVLVTLAGLYLVSRQWDEFARTFLHFLTFEGAGGYLAALFAIKALHELGHAYAATRFGCRVPTMGVAFMVLAPMLYTDVTDAWRLTSKRERLLIDAGGMLVELSVAGLATFAWALLPEGVLKSICFFVATTSWIMSLAINLSPLMRFDGYYILTDLLDIPNLQQRAFALMRWRIRRTAFGIAEVRMENWSAGREALVFIYGLAVTLYRFVLFTGLAVLVYTVTFKLLGILLFAVEIGWFVLKPVFAEMIVWWNLRRPISRSPRSYLTGTATITALGLFVVPWSGRMELPSIMEPVTSYHLSTTIAGQIADIEVAPGANVVAGQILVRLEAPRLESELRLTDSKITFVRFRQSRRLVDQTDRREALVLEQQLASLQQKRVGLERERADLVVRAPMAGHIVDLAEDLHAGRWIGKGFDLGTLVSDAGMQVRGYVGEPAIMRLAEGAQGRFIPEDMSQPQMDVVVSGIAAAASTVLDIPYLSSAHGGAISVRPERDHTETPVETQFVVVMKPTGNMPTERPVMRGTVLVEGESQSFASRIYNRTLGILVRETGF